MSDLPPRLQEIVEDFQFCDGREKLEYLLEFAEQLPELPPALQGQQSDDHQVHECMTPVFVFAEESDGILTYHFDIPAESPTVRGFGEVLRQGTLGSTRDGILAIPDTFYLQTGLHTVLTGQRMNGMGAILHYMKRLAAGD